MLGSARTAPVTVGLRPITAAIGTVALATVLTAVVAVGQFTAHKPGAAPAAAQNPIVEDHSTNSGSAVRPIAK